MLALLWVPARASAHRLDEYLQATTIAIDRQEIVLRLSLTPGVSVAAGVLAQIDVDHDGTISAREQRGYAERVEGNLRLVIDGTPATLRLRASTFAAPVALRKGVGDIVLTLTAPMAPARTHHIVVNHAAVDGQAVYLVNTLVPTDRGIRVAAQRRSYDQSRYQLDLVTVSATPPGQQAATIAQPTSTSDHQARPVLVTFFGRGIRHILAGYDHLLFVVALALGAATLWDLVKVVTAFTVAHSITLTLAALHLVHVPDTLVEPVIAVSIVAVAVQNILRPDRAQSEGRLALAFLFGLFHGLGFASGLLEVMHAMPGNVVSIAILGFSLGVEAANQIVLLSLFGAIRLLMWNADHKNWPSQYIQKLGSTAVAAGGILYLVDSLLPLD